MIKPFLKWVGGKTQIIENLIAFFPEEIDNYYEPFLGGGSVLLALLSNVKDGKIKITGKIYANDINSTLIGVYKNIQLCPETLISEVKKLTDDYDRIEETEINRQAERLEEAKTSQESFYYWIRKKFNGLSKEDKITPTGSAMFLFMNKTCFRGVYREGPNGFNVPFGHYKNPTVLDETHIKMVSELIKDVVFTSVTFTEVLTNLRTGDFVYFDPPYAPETSKSFVSYTSDGFSLENHQTLFKLCNDINTKGIKFLMSNADVKLVRDAFPSDQYKTEVISCRRAVNSKKPGSKTDEVLISN